MGSIHRREAIGWNPQDMAEDAAIAIGAAPQSADVEIGMLC